MTSLRQYTKIWGEKWLWGLTSEPGSKIDDHLGTVFEAEHTPKSGQLTREQLRAIATQEPMYYKGARKKNRDALRDGWTIVPINPEGEVPDNVLKLVDEFNRNAQPKAKLEQIGISGNIYGDGFGEIIYEEPKNLKIDDPLRPNAKPVNIRILNTEYISKKDKRKNDPDISFYIYWKPGKSKVWMHPDRIVHLVKNKLPMSDFGISDIYTLNKVLKSKMNADEVLGEIIYWAGMGKGILKIPNATPQQLTDAYERVKKQKRLHVLRSDWEFLIENPVAMSPKEYTDYFTMNIAAQLEMPQYILTGVQPGQLTGSELGFMDYCNEIDSERELVFKPILERIYKQLLESQGIKWEYTVKFPRLFADENTEADVFKKRTEAGKLLFDTFSINENELRRIAIYGIIDDQGKPVIDPDKPLDEIEEPEEKPPEEEMVVVPLTSEQREMIDVKQRWRAMRKKELDGIEEKLDNASKTASKAKETKKGS